MDIFDSLGESAKSLLSIVAPAAASAFGGPLAGMVTTKLITALGLSPTSTPQELEQAILKATPEQLLALKTMEAEFLKDMKRLDVDLSKIQAEDRASARRREIDTHDSWTPRILAGLVMGLYIGVQWYILGHVIDSEMREVVMRSLGTLDAAVGLILGYYFGSSIGSHQKDARIQEFTEK